MKRYFKKPVSAELLFEKSEFAARRSKLMEKIPDGVAIIMGALDVIGYNEFFQNNDFMYLCGVDIPNSILIIDGVRDARSRPYRGQSTYRNDEVHTYRNVRV